MMLWANRPGSNGETRRVITIDLGRLRLIIMGAFNHDRIHKQQLMKVFIICGCVRRSVHLPIGQFGKNIYLEEQR